ncbi:MAG: YceI family protein [Bacteroidales bacterium]|nr:YceI family protein [Bacteroidales bacterium]MDP2238509.1 YceI family protein [Bacteroidales bacterium]
MKNYRITGILFHLLGFTSIIFFTGMAQKKGEIPIHYQIVSTGSLLYWRADNHRGFIPFCDGMLTFEDNSLTQGNFSICMDSITNTDIDYLLMKNVLENTLKSKEFFFAEKYPRAFFNIYSSFTSEKDKLFVTGDLTLKDITKCISFEADLKIDGDSLFAVSDSIRIDRTDWGIFTMSKNYVKGDEAFIVSDTLILNVKIRAVKK